MYYVEGGIFTNTDFETLIEGTDEKYGPFDTYEEARIECNGKMWQKVDICSHRLFIIED